MDLGSANNIESYTVIRGRSTIGDGNSLGPFLSIGSPGLDSKTRTAYGDKGVTIGDANVIGDFVSIKQGQLKPTRLGSHNTIGSNVSIGHDVDIDSNVLVLPGSIIAGHCVLQTHSLVGPNSTLRPRVVLGAYSTLAQQSLVSGPVPPLCLYSQGRPLRTNLFNLPEGHRLKTLLARVPYPQIPWCEPELAAIWSLYADAVENNYGRRPFAPTEA